MGYLSERRYIGGDGSFIHTILPPEPGSIVRLGVDIGQMRDFTALVVTEEEQRDDGTACYLVRSIVRVPLGTPYPAIVDRIGEVVTNLRRLSEERRDHDGRGFTVELVMDATGVGRPVIDLVRDRGLRPIAVTLTGGDSLTEQEADQVSMAKRYLVSRLIVLSQSKQILLPESPEAEIVKRELADYRFDRTEAANATFNARSGQHDDLVIALGLSTGTGKKRAPAMPIIFGTFKEPRY